MTAHPDDPAVNALNATVEAFIARFRSAILATNAPSGKAHVSYAPFVRPKEAFYVYVSQLAAHSTNLQTNQDCELMLIEDEATASNLFARKRLTIVCQSLAIARNSEEFVRVLTAFHEQCGPVVRMLENLPDFTLFRLTPQDGTFVQAFGNAQKIPFQQ